MRIPVRFFRIVNVLGAIVVLCGLPGGAVSMAVADDKPALKKDAEPAFKPGKDGWVSLFDGKTLKGWKVTDFGGQGEVKVEKGSLVMMWGQDLTGVHTERKLPTIDYEVELECMRVDGLDFFCGLTFPVNDSHASLILGGWGGGVCGISSIDLLDASENETTTYRSFDNKKWYPVKMRVTQKKIEVWCEGKQIVDVEIKDRKISTRSEVDLSKPFGLSCWQTTAAIRKLRIRRLPEPGKQKSGSK